MRRESSRRLMAPGPSTRGAHRGPIRTVILFVGALLFLFEEWLWTHLTRMFGWLGRFGVMRWIEAKLARVPPPVALIVLCVPMALLFPFKVAGLWMIASGRILTGCMLMLAAKVASTAVIAKIFMTCRSQLMRMPWFARVHRFTCELRDRIHRWIDGQPAWNDARRFVRHVKSQVRSWRQGSRRGPLRRWRSRRRMRRGSAMAAGAKGMDGDR